MQTNTGMLPYHHSDKDNFDGEPVLAGRLSEAEAFASNSYFVVARNNKGNIVEALSMVSGKPNYYYTYV